MASVSGSPFSIAAAAWKDTHPIVARQGAPGIVQAIRLTTCFGRGSRYQARPAAFFLPPRPDPASLYRPRACAFHLGAAALFAWAFSLLAGDESWLGR